MTEVGVSGRPGLPVTRLAEETKQEAESVTHLSHSMGGRIARERPRINKNATRMSTAVRRMNGENVCNRLDRKILKTDSESFIV